MRSAHVEPLTLIIVVMIIMYQRKSVLFLESDLYIFAVTTHCFWSSYGLIISSIFSDNEEKVTIWIAPLICL